MTGWRTQRRPAPVKVTRPDGTTRTVHPDTFGRQTPPAPTRRQRDYLAAFPPQDRPEPPHTRRDAARQITTQTCRAAEQRVDDAIASGNEDRITEALRELQRVIRKTYP